MCLLLQLTFIHAFSGWKPPGLSAEAQGKKWVSAIHTGMEVHSYAGVECESMMEMSIEGACRRVARLERSRRLKLAWKTWTWKSSMSVAICFYSLLPCSCIIIIRDTPIKLFMRTPRVFELVFQHKYSSFFLVFHLWWSEIKFRKKLINYSMMQIRSAIFSRLLSTKSRQTYINLHYFWNICLY